MQRPPPNLASVGAAQPSQQGLSKIVITQIFVLLGQIDREKDKTKKETQSEQIDGLILQHGMEVFPKFFRRTLGNNADHIFNGNLNQQGSYELLVKYVSAIRTDIDQADRIAQSIDTVEGDLFKNFDVSKFMDHFKLDPVAKTMLALSLKNAQKQDLRTKANAVLTNQFQNLLMSIVRPTQESGDDLPISYLHTLLDRLVHRIPPSWSPENLTNIQFAIRTRFESLGVDVPPEITDLLQLAELMAAVNPLIKLLTDNPNGTSYLDDCKAMLAHLDARDISYQHVANTLLYIILSKSRADVAPQYDPSIFVAGMKDHRAGKRIDWQDVVGAFDRPNFSVTKSQFLSLYNALLPLAQEYENFDIQRLWGGVWQNTPTQLSFLMAFLSCTPEDMDASTIPRLRNAYSLEQFQEAPEEIQNRAAEAVKYPYVSYDAVKTLFDMIFASEASYQEAHLLRIPELVINPHTDLFILAIGSIPTPWNPLQNKAFIQLFNPFLKKLMPQSPFVMYGLWKRNDLTLIYKFFDIYQNNPTDIDYIYSWALEFGWMPTLSGIFNEFGIEIAAVAHKNGKLNLHEYLDAAVRALPDHYPVGLARILEAKAKAEYAKHKKLDGLLPQLSFSLNTVAEFLDFLDPMIAEDLHLSLLRLCIQSYPRLINYKEGFDEVLEANCQQRGHGLPEEADQLMQDRFRKLYNNEIRVRDMIEDLQRLKQSNDGDDQDCFISIVSGLFDEYTCFPEYPLEALQNTAVLFGGIISYKLINRWALQYAMAMALVAVQTSHSRNDKMYKFGVQALKQFQGRLQEWPQYCERLLQIDLLRGTDIWKMAEEVLQNTTTGQSDAGDDTAIITSPRAEEFDENAPPAFTTISPNSPSRTTEFYEDPSEDVQDKILFALNNVSLANVREKQSEIVKVLQEKHYQWFATYLVDQRAKVQANFQGLYLTLLELFNNENLWEDILRETYISILKLLNAEITMTSSTDKGHLKNLGSWLGALTLARDIPIKVSNMNVLDLLVEAYRTQRLPIVVPFAVKVLTEASKGELFQTQNPWTISVLGVLLELYQFAELRINLKFEIETLFTSLNSDIKKFEPSRYIRETLATADKDLDPVLNTADQLEPFPPMMAQPRPHHGSFSDNSLKSELPDISPRLVYPPHSSNVLTNDQVRQTFATAAQRAISEIVFPVVERSVTIAAIAAGNLAQKDYATEIDENKIRAAAQQVVKQLSGSLALVTCREPLRMSLTNNVRAMFREQNDNIPEGVILMFVNDNLDHACKVIEEAAEKHSIPEIENQLREAYVARQHHVSQNPDQQFNWPPSSNYAFVIPEPYKLAIGGVRPEQAAIYDNFGTGRTHIGTGQESHQQIQNALEHYGVSSMQPDTDTRQPQQRLPPPGTVPPIQPQLNGYGDQPSLQERAESLLMALLQETKESEEASSPSPQRLQRLKDCYDRILGFIDMSGMHQQQDQAALSIAVQACDAIAQETASRLEIDVVTKLLLDLLRVSHAAARHIIAWAGELEDEVLRPGFAVSLVRLPLLQVQNIDNVISKALYANKIEALECLDEVVSYLLLSERPLAIRTNLASSFEALVLWLKREPELRQATALLQKLKLPDSTSVNVPSNEAQIAHIFDEWTQISRPDVSDKLVVAFVHQLHKIGVLKTREQLNIFIKICLDLALRANELDFSIQNGASISQSYSYIDALSSLIVVLSIYQGNGSESASPSEKAQFLDGMLSLVALHLNHTMEVRNQKTNVKAYFRFFSTLLEETKSRTPPNEVESLHLAFAQALLAMQPAYAPVFTFQWFGLVSHRSFFPVLLESNDDMANDVFVKLLTKSFQTLGSWLESINSTDDMGFAQHGQSFYIAVLRLVTVLFNDFQDFLAENYFELLNSIPNELTQMRNLILSAVPVNGSQVPYPFHSVPLDSIGGITNAPRMRTNVESVLKSANLLTNLDSIFDTPEFSPMSVNKYYQAIRMNEPTNKHSTSNEVHRQTLLHAVVLYTCIKSLPKQDANISNIYDHSSPHATFLRYICEIADAEDQDRIIRSMVFNLRYPNVHTMFFLHAILDLFSQSDSSPTLANNNDSDEALSPSSKHLFIQECTIRVLFDHLLTHRPHSWGLVISFIELYKNPDNPMQELPFIKGSTEYGLLLEMAVNQAESVAG